jgi:hypothetical protein
MFSLDALFCHIDDFCKAFEAQWHKKLSNHGGIKRNRAKSLCLSEIMTILIAFHQNHTYLKKECDRWVGAQHCCALTNN